MKLPIATLFGLSFLCAQASFANTTTPAHSTALTSEKDKVSYSIGVDLGENFKNQHIDVNPTLLAKGLQDGIANHPTLLTQQEMTDTLMTLQKEQAAKQATQAQTAAAKNLQEGEAYLAANKQKPGVITTASGLQYKVINPGKGENPTANDVVTVDYKGSLINGKVFDSSYDRKQSATFPVSGVIPGWQEALKLMKPGATFELAIPANLAYGEQGAGNAIAPNQTLLFTVHLVSVKKAA